MSAVTTTVLIFATLAFNGRAAANHPMENDGLFEGDIAGIDPYALLDRNAVVDEAELWPGGIVYYDIDRRMEFFRDGLLDAMDEYHNKTCLKFRKRNSATKDYIYIRNSIGCWSSVGRKGGEQELSLSEGCHDRVSAIHEFGHAIGLWHEHSRSDRDEYLEILWDNIKPGSEHNFLKLKPYENNLLGEKFDYKSIMLYGEYAFAKDRKSMTMRPREEGVVIGLINLKSGLSDSDVRRINKLYECFGNERPPPPEIPDFKCDFEVDLCGLENQDNQRTDWTITSGTLGDRTGNYLMVTAEAASLRKVRIVTPFFGFYGRKEGCLQFALYFNGDGALSLNVMVHDTSTSTVILKHVDKSDRWQNISLDIKLGKDIKISLDAHTRSSAGEGIIAIDDFLYKWRKCDE